MKRLSRLFVNEVPFFLACPALLWEFFFLYAPFAVLIFQSIMDTDPSSHAFHFTFDFYNKVFTPLYVTIIYRSFTLATLTAGICFLIAYPVAYFLVMRGPRKHKSLLLFSLILPSWTSLIVQVYAWFFLLAKDSLLSRFLQATGIIASNVHLLNNYFSIVLGMVSCYLPFMILPIYTVLEKLDKRLLDASADLGADRYETFKHVIFPLSLPGVYAGFLLVFIPSFGEFAVPGLLGGGKYLFWGNAIVDKFLFIHDWRMGASLVVAGISVPLAMLSIFYLVFTIKKRLQERKIKKHMHLTETGFSKDIWD